MAQQRAQQRVQLKLKASDTGAGVAAGPGNGDAEEVPQGMMPGGAARRATVSLALGAHAVAMHPPAFGAAFAEFNVAAASAAGGAAESSREPPSDAVVVDSEAAAAAVPVGETSKVTAATTATTATTLWLTAAVGINDGNNAFGRAGSALVFSVVDGATGAELWRCVNEDDDAARATTVFRNTRRHCDDGERPYFLATSCSMLVRIQTSSNSLHCLFNLLPSCPSPTRHNRAVTPRRRIRGGPFIYHVRPCDACVGRCEGPAASHRRATTRLSTHRST